VAINPGKTDTVTFTAADKLVVLAEAKTVAKITSWAPAF
jgi:hypothetical protein